MRQEIPLLNQVQVEKPCTADWYAMTAIQGEQVKHCAHCQKNVYNLSALTEQDANTLLAENPNLCVRYTQDESGQILTEVSLSQKSSRKIGSQWLFRFIASIVALVTGLVGRSASADTTHKAKTPPKQPVKTQSQPTRHLIMGKRVMPTHTMGKPVRRTPKPEEPKKPSEKTEQGKVPNSKEKSTFTTLGMISNKF